jgi:hypothetical protein
MTVGMPPLLWQANRVPFDGIVVVVGTVEFPPEGVVVLVVGADVEVVFDPPFSVGTTTSAA